MIFRQTLLKSSILIFGLMISTGAFGQTKIDMPECHCHGNENPIFNMPQNATPKVLTRLGTNPEFGNSHDLTPIEFYEKLKNRYNSNSTDKRFLDGIAKAMGYESFSNISGEMFISTTLPDGVTGNLGYGKQHGTIYATIKPTDKKDLKAFRIRAANGCELYFMKTCGNHFFTCSC